MEGDTGYVEFPITSFPLTEDGRRQAIDYANKLDDDDDENPKSQILRDRDLLTPELYPRVFEKRSLTLQRLIYRP